MYKMIIRLMLLLCLGIVTPAWAQSDSIPQDIDKGYGNSYLHRKIFYRYVDQGLSSMELRLCFTWNYCSFIAVVKRNVKGQELDVQVIQEGYYSFIDAKRFKFKPHSGAVIDLSSNLSKPIEPNSNLAKEMYGLIDESEGIVYFGDSLEGIEMKGSPLKLIKQLSDSELKTLLTLRGSIGKE